MRGCQYHCTEKADSGEKIDLTKLNAWADATLRCFSEDRHPILAGALLRFCVDRGADSGTSSSSSDWTPKFPTLTSAARKELATGLAAYFKAKVSSQDPLFISLCVAVLTIIWPAIRF